MTTLALLLHSLVAVAPITSAKSDSECVDKIDMSESNVSESMPVAKCVKGKWFAVAAAVVVSGVAAAYFLMQGAPGYATPEEAAKAFLAAVYSGDRESIRRAIEPECRARAAYADGLADRMALVKPMSDALEKRVGWKRGEWIETPIPHMVNIQHMDSQPITVHGDQAVAGGMVLRKTARGWKVTTRTSISEPVEPTNKSAPRFDMNHAIRTALTELAAGRFKTAQAFNSRCVDLSLERARAEQASASAR